MVSHSLGIFDGLMLGTLLRRLSVMSWTSNLGVGGDRNDLTLHSTRNGSRNLKRCTTSMIGRGWLGRLNLFSCCILCTSKWTWGTYMFGRLFIGSRALVCNDPLSMPAPSCATSSPHPTLPLHLVRKSRIIMFSRLSTLRRNLFREIVTVRRYSALALNERKSDWTPSRSYLYGVSCVAFEVELTNLNRIRSSRFLWENASKVVGNTIGRDNIRPWG